MRVRRTESIGAGFGTEPQDPFGAVGKSECACTGAGGALKAGKLGSARVDGLKCEIRYS